MQCDICSKKKATVHLTEIVDDQISEMHLCEDCAREKSMQMEQQFGLADLLAGLSDFTKQSKDTEKGKLKCSVCQLTYDEFRKMGRLGCGNCYESFRAPLTTLLKKIHGSASHSGKKPLRMAVVKKEQIGGQEQPQDINELRKMLQQAIEAEDFEQAAQLRDKIRSLEQKG